MFHFPDVSDRTRYLLQFAGAVALIVVFGLLMAGCQRAYAKEWGQEQGQYLAPDIQEYYSTLKQPDAPRASCCGDSDAYFTDKTDACLPADGTDCVVVAIITDTRPDELTRPDGSKVARPHMAVGTRVPIPRAKIRKHSIPNPTDHGVVFVSGYGTVYCYEPQPLM